MSSVQERMIAEPGVLFISPVTIMDSYAAEKFAGLKPYLLLAAINLTWEKNVQSQNFEKKLSKYQFCAVQWKSYIACIVRKLLLAGSNKYNTF